MEKPYYIKEYTTKLVPIEPPPAPNKRTEIIKQPFEIGETVYFIWGIKVRQGEVVGIMFNKFPDRFDVIVNVTTDINGDTTTKDSNVVFRNIEDAEKLAEKQISDVRNEEIKRLKKYIEHSKKELEKNEQRLLKLLEKQKLETDIVRLVDEYDREVS